MYVCWGLPLDSLDYEFAGKKAEKGEAPTKSDISSIETKSVSSKTDGHPCFVKEIGEIVLLAPMAVYGLQLPSSKWGIMMIYYINWKRHYHKYHSHHVWKCDHLVTHEHCSWIPQRTMDNGNST